MTLTVLMRISILSLSTEGPPDNQSHAATSPKTKKRGRKLAEDDVNMHIAKSIDKMVSVFDNLGKSTTYLINLKKKVPSKEIWAQLKDIGIEPAFLSKGYMYFIRDPDALQAFNGIPVHQHKGMLPHIVPEY